MAPPSSRGVRRRDGRIKTMLLVMIVPSLNPALFASALCSSSVCGSDSDTFPCPGTGIYLPMHGTKSLSAATQAARPTKKSGSSSRQRNTMSDQPSLAEKMASFSSTDNEFNDRLLKEMQADDLQRTVSVSQPIRKRDSFKFWLAAGGTTLVATASFFMVPVLFPDNGHAALSTASSVFAVLPWTWAEGGLSRRTGMFIMDFMAVVQLLSREQVRDYVRDKVLPSASETLQKMLLMEFWRRIWKFVGSHVARVVHDANKDDEDEESSYWQGVVPSWLANAHLFVKETIQRGSYSIAKRTIQGQVQTLIRQGFKVLVKNIESSIQMLLQQPAPIAIAAS